MNIRALHLPFVNQWEMAIFTMGETKKPKILVFGSKICSYQLKIYPHIEEDYIHVFSFQEKFILSKHPKILIFLLCHYNEAPLQWQNY